MNGIVNRHPYLVGANFLVMPEESPISNKQFVSDGIETIQTCQSPHIDVCNMLNRPCLLAPYLCKEGFINGSLLFTDVADDWPVRTFIVNVKFYIRR